LLPLVLWHLLLLLLLLLLRVRLRRGRVRLRQRRRGNAPQRSVHDNYNAVAHVKALLAERPPMLLRFRRRQQLHGNECALDRGTHIQKVYNKHQLARCLSVLGRGHQECSALSRVKVARCRLGRWDRRRDVMRGGDGDGRKPHESAVNSRVRGDDILDAMHDYF
jgi:hypothetical protein